MKKLNLIYWILTGLFAAMMAASSIPDILVSKDAITIFNQLQLPVYLIVFLGVAKLAGVIAILIPGFPRIKEWAYAGLVIDLVGATYCMIAIHSPFSDYVFMALPLTLAFASYFVYHKRLSQQATA